MKRLLIEEIASRGIADLGLIVPVPAFIHRLRGGFGGSLSFEALKSQLSYTR